MAKTKKEEVVEQTAKEVVQEPKEKTPVKKKPSTQTEDGTYKLDLRKSQKKEEDADTKQETADVVEDKQTEPLQEVVEEVSSEQNTVQDETTPTVEEVKEEVEDAKEEIVKAVEEAEATGEPLPENIDKLMKFMEETGGDLEDYVKLNRDVGKLDDQDVLHEYYKQTKPHLNAEEINFIMNDQFEYDEEVDDEKQIKRKKLALKEQVASARAHLDGQKSKYYEDIKAGSKLTPEQQKAIDFFNRYNEESEQTKKVTEQQKSIFNKKTNEVFNEKFKGFEYNVGDKKFRFNVKDAGKIKETQSDIGNFVKKFLNKDSSMNDADGYHKSLFTAMNADSIAQHFYEQGKADAIKDRVAKDKNINVGPRQAHGEVEAGGLKFKVLGDNSADFKFKIKNKK